MSARDDHASLAKIENNAVWGPAIRDALDEIDRLRDGRAVVQQDIGALRDRLKRWVQQRCDDLTWQEVEMFEDIDMWLIVGEEP